MPLVSTDPLTRMTRDAGWAALLPASGEEPLGRGHVFVQELPLPGPGGAPALCGEIESLRLRAGAGPLPPGPYRLCFERSEEVRQVEVERCEPHLSGRCCAAIRFADAELPITALEVSEGE